MAPEQLNASLVWFGISVWLALTLSVALYFGLKLFMSPDQAGYHAFIIGSFGITPMTFVITIPYALRISRAYFGFWDRLGQSRRWKNRK